MCFKYELDLWCEQILSLSFILGLKYLDKDEVKKYKDGRWAILRIIKKYLELSSVKQKLIRETLAID